MFFAMFLPSMAPRADTKATCLQEVRGSRKVDSQTGDEQLGMHEARVIAYQASSLM